MLLEDVGELREHAPAEGPVFQQVAEFEGGMASDPLGRHTHADKIPRRVAVERVSSRSPPEGGTKTWRKRILSILLQRKYFHRAYRRGRRIQSVLSVRPRA